MPYSSNNSCGCTRCNSFKEVDGLSDYNNACGFTVCTSNKRVYRLSGSNHGGGYAGFILTMSPTVSMVIKLERRDIKLIGLARIKSA